ncbi:hypothetical protein ACFXB4_04830 [Streptomyces lavendulae]|uniref:hypothetical protein n=1 Tax=Streptomyces lavendulae TaxID=1914 RepID=UPI0036AD1FBA
MHWYRVCDVCRPWVRKYPERGVCPRCRHEAHLNTDGLCKPCLSAIRAEGDAEWALGLKEARPRPVQLTVGGTYGDRSVSSRPLRRPVKNGSKVGKEWWTRLRQQRAAPDGPPVLEAQVRGQIPLFTVLRVLGDATVSAIAGRPVDGWDRARAVLEAIEAEHGMTAGWRRKVGEMVRLALAVREAEGAERLPEGILRDLPTNGDAVRLVLLRAGLLEEADKPMRFSISDQPTRTPYITSPAPLPPRAPRQCTDCCAWIPVARRAGFICDPCRHWRERTGRGRCCRCGRDGLALRAGRCRSCHPYRLLDEARPASRQFTQLVISLPAGKGGPFEAYPVGEPVAPDYDERRPALHTSRGQEALFTLRRDWAPVLARLRSMPVGEPPLNANARHLVEEFVHERPGQRPDYKKNTRTLTILMYWLGADTAVLERDVYDLARIDVNLAAKPVCQFLAARGLLVEDPELHRDRDQMWIESVLAALPEPAAGQVRTWVKVMREQGPHEGEPRGYDGIRRYLSHLEPVLTTWTATAGVTSLREITKEQVENAVNKVSGYTRRGRATALRSLFRALKRERVIFRNPARDLPVGDIKGIPKSIPSDLLMGLLDQATTPLGRLVVALTAIHALPGKEIQTLHASGLDLSRGTLEVRRGMLRHTLYLEELTHQLAADWTTYRHRRWPASSNPHLLVSQKSAVDPDHPAVSMGTLQGALPRGLTLSGLRQDRILNEAAQSADPLRLMRLFGITEKTAMHYVSAAHPERTAKLPR